MHGADGWTGGRGGKGADSRTDGWTGPTRLGQADRRKIRGWGLGGADGRIGGLAVWRTGGQADEGVGLGLKGHIPPIPFHSWAPSPLASSERECAGCLGV